MRIELPERTNECWRDPAWRKSKLTEVVELYNLSFRDVSRLTGATEYTVGLWLRSNSSKIGRNTLRLLILELNSARRRTA